MILIIKKKRPQDIDRPLPDLLPIEV